MGFDYNTRVPRYHIFAIEVDQHLSLSMDLTNALLMANPNGIEMCAQYSPTVEAKREATMLH